MANRTFHGDIVTPAGTPLGGWVDLEIAESGAFRVKFHLHCSSALGKFEFLVRAYLTAPGRPTLLFSHRGRVSGVDDADHEERGRHPLLAQHGAAFVAHGALQVSKEYAWTGPVGLGRKLASEAIGIARTTADAAGSVVGVTREAMDSLATTLGPSTTIGVLGGVVVFAVGATLGLPVSSVLILAQVAGASLGAATLALVRHRPLNADEIALARRVFGDTVPLERVLLTNLSSINGRGFTAPGVDGKIYVNLGDAYANPLAPRGSAYPAFGQVLIHELSHAWQEANATFLPGLLCGALVTQAGNSLGSSAYAYGPAGPDWDSFNLEQQASIIDQWYAGNGNSAAYRPLDLENPYYRYVRDNVLRGASPVGAPFRLGAVRAVTAPGDRTGLYLVRRDGQGFLKQFPRRLQGLEDIPIQGKKRLHGPLPTSEEVWSDWIPLDHNRFPAGGRLTAVSARPGEVALYVVGLDGRPWSKAFPDPGRPGRWTPWFVQGNGFFPIGSDLAAVSSQPGEVALFGIGLDGKVYTRALPAPGKADGTRWTNLGDNQFARGTPVTAVSAQSGAIGLYVQGMDGQVWARFFPDPRRPGNWTDWQPLGDPGLPAAAPITALSATPGQTALFAIGRDGKVWSKYFPDPRRPAWTEWFALGDNRFPPGATVSAVSARRGETSLYVVGLDGRVWSKYFPAQGKAEWSGWFPLGRQIFPLGAAVAAVSGAPGATSLYALDSDDAVWTNVFQPVGKALWSDWTRLG